MYIEEAVRQWLGVSEMGFQLGDLDYSMPHFPHLKNRIIIVAASQGCKDKWGPGCLNCLVPDFPGGRVAETANAGLALGLIPGQGTGYHMLQLRPGTAK